MVDIDPKAGQVTLQDGKVVRGDLVVGADGVHSVARKHVPGGDVEPFCCGQSAFRFLVPRKAVHEDPETSYLVEAPGELSIWYGQDRRVVMYPTSNNQMLNFVCIHPEAETTADSREGWEQSGELDRMLQVYSSFDPALLALMKKADPRSIKVWKLLDMKVIPTWTNERLALLGDAAHPFLPHQGQGGAVAIEDAASLAVLLPYGTPTDEISERLKLYEEIRYKRANRIQEISRLVGENPKLDGKC